MRQGNLRFAAAVFVLVAVSSAQAADFDLAAGASVTGPAVGRNVGLAPAAFFGAAASESSDGSAHFVPVGTFGCIGAHHSHLDDLHHEVFLAGAGGRYGRARGFFISEQIAATSARTSALSSRFEFMTTGGWQGDHLILMARHISNAHLIGGGPNHGETMLMVGVHFGG